MDYLVPPVGFHRLFYFLGAWSVPKTVAQVIALSERRPKAELLIAMYRIGEWDVLPCCLDGSMPRLQPVDALSATLLNGCG